MDELSDMQKFAAFVHPVGEIVELTIATNPATLWGFGTWESYMPGRVLIGAGTADSGTVYTAGQTGGEETHTLTVDEMPGHRHKVRVDWSDPISNKLSTNTLVVNNVSINAASNISGNLGVDRKEDTLGDYTGGDQPHNIMQPYGVVYRWLRTA